MDLKDHLTHVSLRQTSETNHCIFHFYISFHFLSLELNFWNIKEEHWSSTISEQVEQEQEITAPEC